MTHTIATHTLHLALGPNQIDSWKPRRDLLATTFRHRLIGHVLVHRISNEIQVQDDKRPVAAAKEWKEDKNTKLTLWRIGQLRGPVS